MRQVNITFSRGTTAFCFDASFRDVTNFTGRKSAIIITDENVFRAHTNKFKDWNSIVLKPGEQYKVQESVDSIIRQLIGMKADRGTFLIGVGGGVVTDITGYVANIYMRGIRFGFVPTTLLAMVDASIGGKNGIDVGDYKNLVGTISQPSFLVFDSRFLSTLPENEWRNGFAEIIKHAAILDKKMFNALESHDLNYYKKRKSATTELVETNARLKAQIVKKDEFETDKRRLLNFGHTLGHAIERQCELSHGEAISVGMKYAATFSEEITSFKESNRVVSLLMHYGLPTDVKIDPVKILSVSSMDKKKQGSAINFVFLEKIGKGVIKKIQFTQLKRLLLKSRS